MLVGAAHCPIIRQTLILDLLHSAEVDKSESQLHLTGEPAP
jgi:hypothetical protein